MDKFAPIKDKIYSLRPAAPWINLVVKAQKQVRRRAERLYRKTRLTVHRQIYQYQRSKTIKVINEEKRKYITNQISNSSNSKQLYSVLKNVTAKSNSLTLPSDTPHQILPNISTTFLLTRSLKLDKHLIRLTFLGRRVIVQNVFLTLILFPLSIRIMLRKLLCVVGKVLVSWTRSLVICL